MNDRFIAMELGFGHTHGTFCREDNPKIFFKNLFNFFGSKNIEGKKAKRRNI